MHFNGPGEADGFAHEALDARTQCQMLALKLLNIAFANLVLIRLQMALVSAPAINEVGLSRISRGADYMLRCLGILNHPIQWSWPCPPRKKRENLK